MKTFFFVSIILVILNPAKTIHVSLNESINSEPENMKGMVDRHNYWREKVGVQQLTWSDELASFAQEWANHLAEKGCDMEHRPRSGEFKQKYGENIYWCSGMSAIPHMVADSWASELEDFNERTLECTPGKVCGHYTQLVWSSTQQVGCAMARCGNQEIWVCNYNPPGNWVGQKPYTKK